ncbi:oligopeptide:H+ symporter [Telmatospirillum sp.]|uniref:peptide MFS transporter n=1 Tax=Telmatospirillum sp. TaxID=2079197 RepID=UPI00284EE00A|nr:oligopeptide:H+ symporter [Telmatospirillum sp.]MDR3439393.1 oligopeptide:H+ symporter [Telmatospirillum sp.]
MSLSLREKLSAVPKGAGALFFIQVFATLSFAVLYSTLVLYATQHLQFSAKEASAIMGVFGAFNYGLHLFGGYLGGRFLSNRNLFVGGMVLQVAGCALISGGSVALLYWGLALFLTGSGLNVTCLNMMLTQRFKPDDLRREGAFLWNYAGMNIGFFVGFSVAGHYQLTENYSSLFIFATVGNVLAIVLATVNWKVLADLNTPLLDSPARQFKLRFVTGVAILLGLVPIVWILLQHPDGTETLVKSICALVAVALIYLTLKHPDPREKNNMWAYLILTFGSLVFWALYQMAPNGLQLFVLHNVDRMVWGIEIAPQWTQNINTIVIVVGGPLMSALFVWLRRRGWTIDVPKQFSTSLVLMGFGFLALPAGIALADDKGMVAFFWFFLSFLLQSIGELLISPVGYAMIGQLAPRRYQGVMMGSWMLVTGLASLFAGDFSGMIPEPTEGAALSTNPAYAKLFAELGSGSVAVGIVLFLLIPFLRRLITSKGMGIDRLPQAEGAVD